MARLKVIDRWPGWWRLPMLAAVGPLFSALGSALRETLGFIFDLPLPVPGPGAITVFGGEAALSLVVFLGIMVWLSLSEQRPRRAFVEGLIFGSGIALVCAWEHWQYSGSAGQILIMIAGIVGTWIAVRLLALWGVRLFVRQVVLQTGSLCKNCAYELRGNVSGTCPECGSSVGRGAISSQRSAIRGDAGCQPSLIVCSSVTACLVLLSLLLLGLWANSYITGWIMSWGDRYRGTYQFVYSSDGGLILARRTNCDVSERFTWFRRKCFEFNTPGPHMRQRGALGFEAYDGTRYCWYAHLYGMLNPPPSWDDPRWQKEPFRAVRVPYWPMALLLVPSTVRLLRRNMRSWRRHLRTRRGSCITCGYNLTGNQSGICPECGSATSDGGSVAPGNRREALGWGWRLALAAFCGVVFADVYFRILYLHAERASRAHAFLVRILGGAHGPDWRGSTAAAAMALVPPFIVAAAVFLLAGYRYGPRRSRSGEETACRAPAPLQERTFVP